MVLEVYPLLFSKPVTQCLPWKGHVFGLSICAKVSQPDSFILFENLAALFCTWFKALAWPSLYGPNTPLHTQVLVSLVPYKLNVSYYYFPFWVYTIWNEVPSMLFVMCNWHDLPSFVVRRYSLWHKSCVLTPTAKKNRVS